MNTAERRARVLLEAWLRGWNEGGNPPLSAEEIAGIYQHLHHRVGN